MSEDGTCDLVIHDCPKVPPPLTLSEYQAQAITTAIYPEAFKIMYPALGAGNEFGEVQGKIKKVYRDDNGIFSDEKKAAIGDEIADCLWYLAALANDLNLDLGNLAQSNLDKLSSRKERGKLGGSGDYR